MPFWARVGTNSLFQNSYWVATSSCAMRWIALNVSVGVIPSGPMSLVSLWICCLMPASRQRLSRRRDLLVPNILRGGGINRILRDVRRVIAHAFEVSRDEHQIQITAELFRILRHAVDQLAAHLSIHLIEFFVPRNQGPGGLCVFPSVSVHGV